MQSGKWITLMLPFMVVVPIPVPQARMIVEFPQVQVQPGECAAKPEFVKPATTATELEARYIEQCLKLTNAERAKAGLAPLKINPTLSQSARWMAEDMAKNNYFDHIDSLGRGVGDRMKEFKYSYSLAGQNIAGGQTTPEEAIEDWLKSPGHRAIMLKPDFDEIGIAYLPAPGHKLKFIWVCDFGHRR
ncbi:MAG: hypothetical protein KF784_11465 [Fimbriimonadaceae bacterium]|nr:hypothetical protein [Fimbriimonadaceae bacterium]